MSCSNQIICYTSPHLSLHVPFFFLLIILTHCYVIVYSFYYPPLQTYLQYKKSLSNIIHLSYRQIPIELFLIVSKFSVPNTIKHVSQNSFIVCYLILGLKTDGIITRYCDRIRKTVELTIAEWVTAKISMTGKPYLLSGR